MHEFTISQRFQFSSGKSTEDTATMRTHFRVYFLCFDVILQAEIFLSCFLFIHISEKDGRQQERIIFGNSLTIHSLSFLPHNYTSSLRPSTTTAQVHVSHNTAKGTFQDTCAFIQWSDCLSYVTCIKTILKNLSITWWGTDSHMNTKYH